MTVKTQYAYEGKNSHRNARRQAYADVDRSNARRSLGRLAKQGYEVRMITEFQYRINGALDVYPTNNKWHNIKTGERGTYSQLTRFVKSVLTHNR